MMNKLSFDLRTQSTTAGVGTCRTSGFHHVNTTAGCGKPLATIDKTRDRHLPIASLMRSAFLSQNPQGTENTSFYKVTPLCLIK